MPEPIKMLALDIDGTLVGKDYILRDEVISSVRKVIRETTIKVILASGRMTHSTIPIAELLGVKTPLIVYQGAMVNDIQNNKILFHQTLEPETALQIINDIEKEGIHVNLYINDTLMMKQISDIASSYSSARYVKPIVTHDYSILKKNPPTKIVGLDYDTKKIAALSARLEVKYSDKLNIFNSMPEFIEAVNPEINKGQTVMNMAKELWGFEPENIMAIGDGNNDYDMIRLAGYGVAMGNATDHVKSVAKYVTGSVENLGIIQAINHFIFNEACVNEI